MANTNFSFEKRRKEQAKKLKKEEKKQRKLDGTTTVGEADPAPADPDQARDGSATEASPRT